MRASVVQTGYRPRPMQEFLHKSLKRFNVLVLHRRAGKTVFSINEMIDRAVKCPRKNPQVCYIAPTYGAAKRIAWNYLKEYTSMVPGIQVHEGELRLTIPRADKGDEVRIYLLGAENPNALRGLYLDFAIIDEYSEMNPEIWTQVVRPALSDRLGGAIFIFTPKGSNHSFDIYRNALKDTSGEWFAALLTVKDTGLIQEKELEAARAVMSEAEFAQEFMCDFSAALVGAYYKNEMLKAQQDGRITKVSYDSHAFVWTAWDLGMDDQTAVWFIQECGRELHVIDYFEISGAGFDKIVPKILETGYMFAGHILPHDAAVRELGTGKSRSELLRDKFKLKGIKVAPKLRVEDGIAAVRSIFSRLWFDQDKCYDGIEALKSYERKFDPKENTFKSAPRHNWASHGADALRTFATGYRLEEDRMDNADLPRVAEGVDYDVMGY